MPASESAGPSSRVRPFLKWAGGKRQLLATLRRFVPPEFGAYHEPFLGSGALFFDLSGRGIIAGRRCRLTDINVDLVGCYRAIAHDVDAVIRALELLAAAHRAGAAEAYYHVRDRQFNPRRRDLASGIARSQYPADLAAMFVYLNRTGYNGLFRVNGRGEFNVPAGRYANPRVCDADVLRAVAGALTRPSIEIAHDSFTSVLETASRGDFVYLDPPYAPLSPTARFTSYTASSFSDDDQRRLQELVLRLARTGSFVTLSNSTAPLVTRLYVNRDARAAGLRAHRVPARRAINSKGDERGQVEEYVISNVTPQD